MHFSTFEEYLEWVGKSDQEAYKLMEKCYCCTEDNPMFLMKFIARTGHWICKECFFTAEPGHYMAQAQMGYKWVKDE
jgi:hypothetical protein